MEQNNVPYEFISAVQYGTAAEVDKLIKQNPELVNAKYSDGCKMVTPLLQAITKSKLEVVRVLLNHGARCDAKDSNQDTPLHFAAAGKEPKILQELIKSFKSNNDYNIDIHNFYKRTPLHAACEKRKEQCVEVLLKAGAALNVQDCMGKTPLHFACEGLKSSTVQLLLNAGADPLIQARAHPCLRIRAEKTAMFYAMVSYRIALTDNSIPAVLLAALPKLHYMEYIRDSLDYACELSHHKDSDKKLLRLLVNIILDSAKKRLAYNAFVLVVQKQIKKGNLNVEELPEELRNIGKSGEADELQEELMKIVRQHEQKAQAQTEDSENSSSFNPARRARNRSGTFR